MLLHDTLNMLATNTDDAFVVLVRYMERNRGGHFLFNQRQSLFHGVVVRSNDVNVEVVLPKTVEHNLDIACDIVSLTPECYIEKTYSVS